MGEREQMRVAPHERDEAVPEPAQQDDAVAALPAVGNACDVAHEADAADDRRRRDRRAAGLVVERDVPETTGIPSESAACEIPSIACASSQPISGFSGLPKLRQSVRASGSPPAQATFSAASITAAQPASTGLRQPSGGPSSETAMPRVPSIRSTAASRPGRRTVREPTRWSYCSNTQVFGSSVDRVDGRRLGQAFLLLDLVARAFRR